MKIDGFSIETTPGGARTVGSFAALLPQGTRVFVTHLPNGALGDIVRTAARLAGAGMLPVPHIGARHLESPAVLDRHLEALRAIGVSELLLVGGDRNEPLGPFSEAGDLIGPAAGKVRAALFRRSSRGRPRRGVACQDSQGARRRRRSSDCHAVRVRSRSRVDMGRADYSPRQYAAPVRLGLPGVASPGALLRYARAVRRRALAPRTMARRPPAKDGRALDSGGADCRPPERASRPWKGLHFFPFGGFAETAAYLADARQTPSERRWNQS